MVDGLIKGALFLAVVAALILLALAGPAGKGVEQSLAGISAPPPAEHLENAEELDGLLDFEAANLPEADLGKMLATSVVVDPEYSHADLRHPQEAAKVRECLDKNGPYMVFMIERGKRYLRVCILPGNIVGFQIVDIIGRICKEKTAYFKEELKNITELLKYADKMGYVRFKGLLP